MQIYGCGLCKQGNVKSVVGREEDGSECGGSSYQENDCRMAEASSPHVFMWKKHKHDACKGGTLMTWQGSCLGTRKARLETRTGNQKGPIHVQFMRHVVNEVGRAEISSRHLGRIVSIRTLK